MSKYIILVKSRFVEAENLSLIKHGLNELKSKGFEKEDLRVLRFKEMDVNKLIS